MKADICGNCRHPIVDHASAVGACRHSLTAHATGTVVTCGCCKYMDERPPGAKAEPWKPRAPEAAPIYSVSSSDPEVRAAISDVADALAEAISAMASARDRAEEGSNTRATAQFTVNYLCHEAQAEGIRAAKAGDIRALRDLGQFLKMRMFAGPTIKAAVQEDTT